MIQHPGCGLYSTPTGPARIARWIDPPPHAEPTVTLVHVLDGKPSTCPALGLLTLEATYGVRFR